MRTRPVGATFKRPSSVRRITSEATSTRLGTARIAGDVDAVGRGQDGGDLLAIGLVLDEGGGLAMGAHEAEQYFGVFLGPPRTHGQQLLHARGGSRYTKCRITPMPKSTATEFQGAPTQKPSTWPLTRLSTM